LPLLLFEKCKQLFLDIIDFLIPFATAISFLPKVALKSQGKRYLTIPSS